MEYALKTVDLHKSFKRPERTINVLNGISLKIPQGKFAALTGQSGCGKTTLLQMLGALDEPTSGRVICHGENVTSMGIMARSSFRLRQIGFIFQSYQLLPELSSLENITLAGRLGRSSMNEVKDRAAHLLKQVNMDHRANHRPAELSGGEQQRIAIARALMNDPAVILADEPTGNLDAGNTSDIIDLLKALRDDHKKTVLMVTHSQELAAHADIVFQLSDGKLSGTL